MNPDIKYPSLPRGDYPTCKTCIYGEDSPHKTRYCHRHTPRTLNFNHFPELGDNQYCGDGMWYVKHTDDNNDDGCGFLGYKTILDMVFSSRLWQAHRDKKDRR